MENLKTIYYIDQIQNEVEQKIRQIMRKYGFVLKNLNY